LKIGQAYNDHKEELDKEQKKQDRIAEAARIKNLPDNIKLIHGDFIDRAKEVIRNNPVSLICVDPPYAEKYLPLYNGLGDIGTELEDGTSMAVYCPQLYFWERVTRVMQGGKGKLNLYWLYAIFYGDGGDVMHPKRTFIGWKPIPWFVKGKPKKDYLLEYVPDIIISPKPDKTLDRWAQSTVDAEHVIEYLTVQNEIVFDPMMGPEATTGKACLNLGRKFIGIEIDKENYDLAYATLKLHSKNIKDQGSIAVMKNINYHSLLVNKYC
jgi:hypothetical protein